MSDEDKFILLKELCERIQNDVNNAGWYLLKAYELGKETNLENLLDFPPAKTFLRLVK